MTAAVIKRIVMMHILCNGCLYRSFISPWVRFMKLKSHETLFFIISMKPISFTNCGGTKCPISYGWHLSVCCIQEELLHICSNFTEIYFSGCNWQYVSIGSGNCVALNRRQAIIWSNDGPINQCIYASLVSFPSLFKFDGNVILCHPNLINHTIEVLAYYIIK